MVHHYFILKHFIMLKNISKLGKALVKAEQKKVSGGRRGYPTDCTGLPNGTLCDAGCPVPGMCAGGECYPM